MVLSYAGTDFPDEPRKVRDPKSPHRSQVLAIDIPRAYFNAVAREDEPTCVELPPEVGAPAGNCALLKRHMYATQRAADGGKPNTQVHSVDSDSSRMLRRHACSDINSGNLCAHCMATTSLCLALALLSIGLKRL